MSCASRIAILAALLLFPETAPAQDPPASPREAPVRDGVVFLTLAVTDGGLVPESATLRPGRVKVRRGLAPSWDWIHYELISGDGTMLFRGATPDPRAQRRRGFEHLVDGRFQKTPVIPEPEHIVIRMPYVSETRQVKLYSRSPEAASTDPTGVGRRTGPVPDLGVVDLRFVDLEAGSASQGGGEARGRPDIRVSELSTRKSLDGRINILYIAEGFTADDMYLFRGYARDAFDYLTETEPWATYAPYFSAHTIEAVSRESGSDHPGTASDEPGLPIGFVDTMFNSSFDTGGVHRCCYVHDVNLVMGVLADTFVQFDLVNFIVNSGWHGGCGGEFAVNTIHGESRFTSLHEIGHVFAGLADEYESSVIGAPAPVGAGPNQYFGPPNITQETDRDLIPWKDWIEPDTPIPTPEDETLYGDVVGLFRGAGGSLAWYRPKFTCAMRDHLEPFCEVCSQAIVLEIYALLSPIQDSSPAGTGVSLGASEAVTLSVVPREPLGHALEVSWSLDGVPVPGADQPSLEVQASDLDPGIHSVTAAVHDPTPFVRNDPDDLLTDTRTWLVDRSTVSTAGDSPRRLNLGPGLPNPFSSRTTIAYSLPGPGRVRLSVHDALGRRVAVLVDRVEGSGPHTVIWDGRRDDGTRAAAGIYLVRLDAAGSTRASKLILAP